MNRAISLAVPVPRTCVRRLYSAEVGCKDPAFSRVKQKQIHFQKDDDVPVYLKGGSTDKALFMLTGILTFVSAATAIHSTYKLATKK